MPLAAIVLLFGAYLAAGYWGVPQYMRSSLAAKFQEKTGMLIDFEHIAFDPFSFVLDLSGIKVFESKTRNADDSGRPLLEVASFSADLAPVQLLRGELVTTSLIIDNFDLHLVRDIDGNYNISPLATEKELQPEEEILNFSELPFRFSLNNISARHSRILFEDKPKNGSHAIEKIDLTLPNLSNFSFAAKEYIHPSFRAVVNGSPIEMTGQAMISGEDATEMQTNLECSFNDIDLPLYLGYLPIQFPFDITRGRADATFNLTFSPTAKDKKLLVEFSIQAEDTSLESRDKSFSLEIPSSKLEGGIQPITGDTQLKNIVLRQPELRLASHISIEEAVAAASSAISEPAEGSAQPISPHHIGIDLLLADSGSLILVDEAKKPLAGSWSGIQATLKNYSNQPATRDTDTPTTFKVVAESSDKKATLTWQGKLDHANLPGGELQFTGIDTPWLFNRLGLTNFGASAGIADTRAHIGFSRGSDEDEKPQLNIADASLTLHNFSAKQEKDVWYASKETKISNFSKQGNRISLGVVSVRDGSVELTLTNLPPIFKSLSDKQSATVVDALDFNGSIAIKSGTSSQPPLQFSNAKLQAIRLSPADSNSSRDNSTFTADLNESGKIQAKGEIQLQPFSVRYATEFTNLESTTLLPWFTKNNLLAKLNSTIDGRGELIFPNTSFTGQLNFGRGSLSDKDTKLLAWDNTQLRQVSYQASPLSIAAGNLSIDRPQLALTQSYGEAHSLARLHSHLQREIVTPLYKAAGNNAGALKIDKIEIKNGEMRYADTRLSPVWKGDFSAVSGTIEPINSAGKSKPALFSFSGKLDSIPFTYQGQLSLFSAAMSGDSTFSITDFPLPSFHQQLTDQLDIDTSRGLVKVTETTRWENGRMDQRSELVFSDVEPLSDSAESALTLALISNEENQFTLTAENSQPDSAKPFNLYTDAVYALRKMMVKASVSPLLLASGNYSDLVGNEYADFLPGEIIPSGRGRESISRFSNLLAAHPYIGITVTGIADPEVDGRELKEALEELERKRVAEENRRRSEQLNQETEMYLRQAAEARIAAGATGQVIEEDLPVHLFSKYAPIEPEPVVIDDSMLLQLADQRAKVIATFFVENLALDASRIKINHQSRISSNDVMPGNRVQFSIEPYPQERSQE